ncbi:MAG: alpha/beta hydrolase [Chitinispirillaceae bacterium]
MGKTVVFGGWAVEPDLLVALFGEEAQYVDVNLLMPLLFESDRLKKNWVDVVISETGIKKGEAECISGWSTGAMIAYEASKKLNPQRAFLLSATPCFCRKGSYRFGTRQSVLDSMIGSLDTDRHAVLSSFFDRCGIPCDDKPGEKYSTDQLKSGLQFLREADLHPLEPLLIKPIFLQGSDDEIIPKAASVYFSQKTGGVHIEFPGPHAFFLENPAEVVTCMEDTIKYLDNLA